MYLLRVRKIKGGGGKFIAIVPDCRFTFDKSRPVTSLEHLVSDYNAKSLHNDLMHLVEFNANVYPKKTTKEVLVILQNFLNNERLADNHWHTFTPESFEDMLKWCQDNVTHYKKYRIIADGVYEFMVVMEK